MSECVANNMSVALNSIFSDFQQLAIRYDSEDTALWVYMNPLPRPCFTPTLLSEIKQFQQSVIDNYESLQADERYPVNYVVSASQIPEVFNLGGDLDLFALHIMEKDRDKLLRYATACIDVLYNNIVSMDLPVTTISLVEGTALGGGFEAALSSNVLIAEESAELGLPEILFNLFPGMGAYSLLARRIGMVEAEKMITSGRVYQAGELYQMGVIDILVKDGAGKEAVRDYIKQHMRSSNGRRAIMAARQRFNPLTYDELLDITKIWVDAALKLSNRDLRMMQRLVNAQDRRRQKAMTENGQVRVVRTTQDRRILDKVKCPCIDRHGNIVQCERRKIKDQRLSLAGEPVFTMKDNSIVQKC